MPFKNFLRDPLCHFLVIGGVVFGLFSWLGEPDSEVSRNIRIPAGEIEAMQKFWEKGHFRPPTEAELDALIDSRLKEEVLYREALAMGMSEGDLLIRRRLAQKMEFLSEGLVDPGEPSEADLRAYAEANPERFQEPAQISFEHIYLNPDRRGEHVERDARALLVSMKNSPQSKKSELAGDPILLNSRFDLITPTSLAGIFGKEFTQAILKFPSGEWQGPVPSAYGLHLVYIQQKKEARMPEFLAIREKVRQALLEERRRDAVQSLYESLRGRYSIVVEGAKSHNLLHSSPGKEK